MRRAMRLLMLGTMAISLGGCGLEKLGKQPDDVLGSVRYSYTYAFQTFTRTVTISPEGLMHVAQLKGSQENIQNVDVQLTAGQQHMIAGAFKGWNELAPFYSIIFGPTITIEYNGHRVESSGGEDTPAKFKDAQNMLDVYAQAALNYKYPESAPTTEPASMPAAAPLMPTPGPLTPVLPSAATEPSTVIPQ